MTVNWHELFVTGSLGFWALVLAETVLLIAFIERGKGSLATASLVATFILLYFFGDVDLIAQARHHPWSVAAYGLGYFAVGTLWAVGKWWLYVRDQRARYDELRADFCEDHEVRGAMPEALQSLWLERLNLEASRGRKIEVRPRARLHKGRIVTWMSYWPWSLFWTLLSDPVRKGFLLIYHHMHDYLQEISDHAFKGVENDLPPDAWREFGRRTDGEAAGKETALAHPLSGKTHQQTAAEG